MASLSVRFCLELGPEPAPFLKRSGRQSMTFTDSGADIHLFEYFDQITELEGPDVSTSNSLVLLESRKTVDLDTLTESELHFLSLHLAFPSSHFARYLSFAVAEPVELIIRTCPTDPKKTLKNLLFGLRSRFAQLTPELKFFDSHNTLISDQPAILGKAGCGDLPENFKAYNRPVVEATEIAALPEKLVASFEMKGGLPQPGGSEIPAGRSVTIRREQQQLRIWQLVESEKLAMYHDEIQSRFFRLQKNELMLKNAIQSLNMGSLAEKIIEFLGERSEIQRGDEPEVSAQVAHSPQTVVVASPENFAMETWERRLEEAHTLAEMTRLAMEAEFDRNVVAMREELEISGRQLQDERKRVATLERENRRLVTLLENIRDGRVGNFSLKRGVRKFDI